MDFDIAYPAAFPTASVVRLYNHVRAGTVYEHRDQVGKDFWIFQGYAQRSVLGEPGQATSLAALTDEERGHCQALVAELQLANGAEEGPSAGEVEALAKDRPLLRFLIENGLPLLLKLLM